MYLDLEDSGIRDNCTKAEVLRHATIFCETLQAAGYSVGVYAQPLLVDDHTGRPGL